MLNQQQTPTITVTPRGIMINGMPLTKSASQNLLPETMRYVRRAEQLLAKVKPEDWNNRTPHAANDVPLLAQAQMMAALASPQPYPSLQKQNWQQLYKDASDDSDDDAEDEDENDDSDGSDEEDGGDSDFDAKHPRWPAGSPDGAGGEFKAKDGSGTGEYQVADSGQIMTDAASNSDNTQDDIDKIKNGIQTANGFFKPTSSNPDASGNYLNQVNIFVGGALDQSYAHIVQTSDALASSYGSNYYFNNAQQPDIDAFIDKLPPDTTVNLIGHSWGGDTAARVALDNPDTIDNLITVDPVTTFHIFNPDFNAVENSVDNWINIYAKPQDETQSMGDFWANIRQGRWGTAPDGIANTFIQANQHHEGFDNMLNTQKNGVTPRQVINSSSQD